MARIDLINVGKTLGDREGVGSGGSYLAVVPPIVSAPTGRGRPSAFSIQNLDLTISDGETMVVLGPSGCGKTTLARAITLLRAGKVDSHPLIMHIFPLADAQKAIAIAQQSGVMKVLLKS